MHAVWSANKHSAHTKNTFIRVIGFSLVTATFYKSHPVNKKVPLVTEHKSKDSLSTVTELTNSMEQSPP
jgi:hypothetical protein